MRKPSGQQVIDAVLETVNAQIQTCKVNRERAVMYNLGKEIESCDHAIGAYQNLLQNLFVVEDWAKGRQRGAVIADEYT
jgi:porphobilinogen deaminase